jgi:DNA-binding transcriptional LysR family regulator
MSRDLLVHLPVLVAVARRASFAGAAAELGMSPSAVSHAVRQVEERLGAPVFARTTRSVALTEAGEALVEGVAAGLDLIDERMEAMASARGKVSGTLRLNVPRISLPLAVSALVDHLARRHPDLVVETFVDDGLADIVGSRFDAGVRVGGMVSQDMVTVRLTPPYRSLLVAAPNYLASSPPLRTLDDIATHRCISYRMVSGGGLYRWDLLADGRETSVQPGRGPIVNDMLFALELARAGHGIAYTFEPLARDDIEAARLVPVLEAHAIEEDGLFLYFPQRAAKAPKLRACIEAIRELARGAP